MQNAVLIVSIIGFLLSLYAVYIEHRAKPGKAICDINEHISCTKAFQSEYGKTFGVSNAIGGLLFYVLVFVLALLNYNEYVFYLAVLSVLGSIYLGYISYAKLKNFCLVCSAIYVVNILLLVFSYSWVYYSGSFV